MYLTFYYSQGEVIIFEGVKITDTQFGQNFEAIFRENGGPLRAWDHARWIRNAQI